MATKSDNLKRIAALETILEVDVITTGLDAGEIQILVDSLEADFAQTPAVVVMVIDQGKSVTSKRGILNAGDEVFPRYLSGGKESFNSLVEKGYIVKG